MASEVPHETPPHGLLPRLLPVNSVGYYIFLALIAVFILGPLGGVTASYMNFSLGFFVGGQVLAGILGSTVTYFYGSEGKHAANYMQTAAASVASMSAMGVLIQAMVWLGMVEPPAWQLFLYFLCVGMFGVGVGMIYTPILVDRLQLTYPSGVAVAAILRALTDLTLLKQSITKLFSGMAIGAGLPLAFEKLGSIPAVGAIASTGLATSTVGAGAIVGARIAIPAIVYGYGWHLLTPWLRAQGWLGPEDPFRKFSFVVALGMIMGAATIDIGLILRQAAQRLMSDEKPQAIPEEEAWKATNQYRLYAWLVFWGLAVVAVTTQVLHVPLFWVLVAIVLSFIMMFVNGISLGITDSNPISSAFVFSIILMAGIGMKDPVTGLMAGSIVFVVCSIGGDMQQDRSTGWRLGTNRTIQFRYQVIGVLVGAVLAVYMAKLFMQAYPVLKIDTFSHPEQKVAQWQSAMTYKFVGALRGLTDPKAWQIPAVAVGVALGAGSEILRKLIKNNEAYKAWSKQGNGFAFDFTLDCALLPSPYASSFGGFVELLTSMWFAIGGTAASAWNTWEARQAKPAEDGTPALPSDMSLTALVGGGLIAGDSIAALVLGVLGLLTLVG